MKQNIIDKINDAGINPHKASDKELLDVKGIGKRRLEKVRNLRAVSTKYFQIMTDMGVLTVLPGMEIPEEYDPMKYVRQGQAEWR